MNWMKYGGEGGEKEDSRDVLRMPASAFLWLKGLLSVPFHPISQRQGASVARLMPLRSKHLEEPSFRMCPPLQE